MRRKGFSSGAAVPSRLSEPLIMNTVAADSDVDAPPPQPTSGGHVTAAAPSQPPPPPPVIVNVITETLPMCGSVSVAGRMRVMEDAIAVKKNLCRPEINLRLPVHFFGVYDGHAGAHVK